MDTDQFQGILFLWKARHKWDGGEFLFIINKSIKNSKKTLTFVKHEGKGHEYLLYYILYCCI